MPRPTSLNIVLNGVPKSVPVADGSEPLLFVLRNKLDQVGPKVGCGAEQCGVCTVLVNGAAVRSCCAEVKSIPGGADVRTLDGLAENKHGKPKRLHALQRAFIEEQAAQCAFCSNGMIMSALAWLNGRAARGERDVPSDDEVKRFLSGKGPGAASVTSVPLRCTPAHRARHPARRQRHAPWWLRSRPRRRRRRRLLRRRSQWSVQGRPLMNTAVQLSRRRFLAASGHLTVGFSLTATLNGLATAASTTPDGRLAVDSWLEISGGNDTLVTIYAGKVELGTGVRTALTQIVAEELAVTFHQVAYVQGDTDRTPGSQGYTAGSKTIQNEGPSLRLAAATAFQGLLGLAAAQFGVSASQLRAKHGRIGIGDHQRGSKTYGQLVGSLTYQMTSSTAVPVKPTSEYSIVGKSVKRVDCRAASPPRPVSCPNSSCRACCMRGWCARPGAMPRSSASTPLHWRRCKRLRASCRSCAKAISWPWWRPMSTQRWSARARCA